MISGNILSVIDYKNKLILKKGIDKYKNYDNFFNQLKEYWIDQEFELEGIIKVDEDYSLLKNNYKEILDKVDKFCKKFTLTKEFLEYVQFVLTGQFGVRKKNIIHRHFLHEIDNYKVIETKLDKLFLTINEIEDQSIFERYIYIHYNLNMIFPYWNALSIRLISNLLLLKYDYIPIIIPTELKSNYFYSLQHYFNKFQNSFFKIVDKSYDTLILHLDKNDK